MTLECRDCTLNNYAVVGFKPIVKLKVCIISNFKASNLRCEMTIMLLNRVSGRDTVLNVNTNQTIGW